MKKILTGSSIICRNGSMTFTLNRALNELVHHYDGFILDQFGVMHNGKDGLPGAVDCVHKLKSLNKKLIILSNTSTTSQNTLAKLPKMGFDPDMFVGAVTSGEEASHYIRKIYGSGSDRKKAIWLTWNDISTSNLFLSKCGNVEPTNNVKEADFVIAHGSQAMRGNTDDSDDVSLGSFMDDGDLSLIDPILKRCHEQSLPMVCANPDMIVKVANGKTAYMPGKIAQKFEEIGGTCTNFGKPHRRHFEACLRELQLDAHRVVHIGDSLHHDIAGASSAGISSIFVTGGIHSDFFDLPLGEMPTAEQIDALCELEGHHVPFPTHVIPMFKF
mmetsp:Transcript_18288/g.22385  ORF Transcript_18288/g.22385 Transcript_18288/m.22385 type:complete len:329 (-) Transcript_18288:65-1051(-)